MTQVLLGLPPFIRSRLKAALESGMLRPPFTVSSVQAALGGPEVPTALLDQLTAWERSGVSGGVAASWIRSLEDASSSAARASLVWTGPPARGLHSRSTRQVFEELVRGAVRSLWITTYTYFDGPEAFRLLSARMATVPSMSVTLLLNIRRRNHRVGTSGQVTREFARRFWDEDWPGKARPQVYFDPRSLARDGPKGILHAKAVVADEDRLLVTSANLTEAAMDRNIEIGLLLRDRTLAQATVAHFRALIEQGLLKPLPSV